PRVAAPARRPSHTEGSLRVRSLAGSWVSGGPESLGRRPRLLHGRRRVRPPRAFDGLGGAVARGARDVVYALPAGAVAGRSPSPVRIPDDGLRADRPGYLERGALRRRERAR